MDIIHILRDIESFDFYIKLRVTDMAANIKEEARFQIYLDQQEKYKNV